MSKQCLRFTVLSSIIAATLLSCASKPPIEPFYSRLYSATYDEVWTACIKVLNDYPLKISNKDIGKIQTEVVNGPYNELFLTYPEPLEVPERFRYSLKFNFAKLESEDKSPVIRIRIIKELERFQDFYTGWIPYSPDGLEERILLYRVEHTLKMQQQISKAGNKN